MRIFAVLIVLAVAVTISSASIFKAADYASFFSRFTKTFSRQYTANDVKSKLNIFKSNIDKITLTNAKAPGALRVNGLADVSADEFNRMLAFRAPASVYAAVRSIAQGKNRDGGNSALALLQAEEDINAPVNEEALAAVDAYAASFLDIGTDSEAASEAEESVSNSPQKTNSTSSTAVPPKAGNAVTNLFGRITNSISSTFNNFNWGRESPQAVAARKAEEARLRVAAERMQPNGGRNTSIITPPKPLSAERAELLAFADAGFDWRTRGVLGEPRHQRGCGSCWAYSTISTIEASFAIKHKISPPVLSEQHLVDCDSTNFGCKGGWYANSFKFAAQNGLRSTAAYGPYKIKQEECRGSSVAPYEHKIAGGRNVFLYSSIQSPSDYHLKMIKAVKEDGPVAAAIYAPPMLQFWGKGVFLGKNCSAGQQINHAVVIVGYGLDKETNTRYWIIRNSWGRTWGDGTGHYRMERHETENTCSYHVGAYVPTF